MNVLIAVLLLLLGAMVTAALLDALLLPGWAVWPTMVTVFVVVASITIIYMFRRAHFGRGKSG